MVIRGLQICVGMSVLLILSDDTSNVSGVAWVIGAGGGRQFCRPPQKLWDAWRPLMIPILPLLLPIFAVFTRIFAIFTRFFCCIQPHFCCITPSHLLLIAARTCPLPLSPSLRRWVTWLALVNTVRAKCCRCTEYFPGYCTILTSSI